MAAGMDEGDVCVYVYVWRRVSAAFLCGLILSNKRCYFYVVCFCFF